MYPSYRVLDAESNQTQAASQSPGRVGINVKRIATVRQRLFGVASLSFSYPAFDFSRDATPLIVLPLLLWNRMKRRKNLSSLGTRGLRSHLTQVWIHFLDKHEENNKTHKNKIHTQWSRICARDVHYRHWHFMKGGRE